MYRITKHYGHEQGLSCTFRQWRAPETHCSDIHGYALAFTFVFESETLDERNWVISFGELKALKQWLQDSFDHKMCVAHDDPKLGVFLMMEAEGIAQLNIVKDVGCEKFAEMAWTYANDLLADKMVANNTRLVSVTVAEHSGNSATYIPSRPSGPWGHPAPVQKDNEVLAPKSTASVVNVPATSLREALERGQSTYTTPQGHKIQLLNHNSFFNGGTKYL